MLFGSWMDSGYEPRSQSDWDLGDHSGGCVRKTKFQCETPNSSNKDRFLALPEHAQSVGADSLQFAYDNLWVVYTDDPPVALRLNLQIYLNDLSWYQRPQASKFLAPPMPVLPFLG
ncbi:hypothetical protein RJT34_03967 [Clitoria ternatea]|uniref:Uncharacterized protein n=1 Tax=Clitoria ternatea TaxID=43366 RepID=A0AAN9Q5M0_CLITE